MYQVIFFSFVCYSWRRIQGDHHHLEVISSRSCSSQSRKNMNFINLRSLDFLSAGFVLRQWFFFPITQEPGKQLRTTSRENTAQVSSNLHRQKTLSSCPQLHPTSSMNSRGQTCSNIIRCWSKPLITQTCLPVSDFKLLELRFRLTEKIWAIAWEEMQLVSSKSTESSTREALRKQHSPKGEKIKEKKKVSWFWSLNELSC